jgi:hypothetical protein
MSTTGDIHEVAVTVDGFTFRLARDDGPITEEDLDNLMVVVHAMRKLHASVRAHVVASHSST